MRRTVHPMMISLLRSRYPGQDRGDRKNPYYLTDIDTILEYRNYTNGAYQQFQFDHKLISQDEWIENELKIRAESPSFEIQEEITLDLVFHILHTTDMEKVQEDIDFQLEVLNQDFGSPTIPEKDPHDPDGKFQSLATDTGIRFKRSEYAGETDGIAGVATIMDVKEKWADYNAMKKQGLGSPPVSPTNTINIWVISTDESIGSYAQSPGGPPETDGIVIDQRWFGRGSMTYTGGKTLTHLVGNYLGLIDLWGLYPCTDDGVEDTPIHNAPNLGDPTPIRISTCIGYPAAMVVNFMDNTDDKNMYMFTRGQAQRMRYILSTPGLRSDFTTLKSARQ
ncbi:MAG: hypothetical protein IPL46_30365 [Saprospiraceae bacterium]|nr:hypothetical protein [Saprospiraceae bacterium]